MKKLMIKAGKGIFPFLILVFITGCWDYMEVEDRGYILAIAIDVAHPLSIGQEEREEYLSERDIEKMPLQMGQPKYAYTLQMPIIPHARIRPEAGAGETKDRTWELTLAGNSFFEANRQFSTRLDFPPFYEHLKAIIISEEVAREGIYEVLDVILRDHEMRRRTRIFITPGEAKKVLDVNPRIEDYSALYLEKLPHNATKTSRMMHKTDLGEVSKSIHGGLDFVLPRVVATKDEIKNAGAAVFKGDKMVGWVGEIDSIYLKWIKDAVLGGIILIDSPNETGTLITLEITKAKVDVRPVIENDFIKMKLDVKGRFNLSEEMRTSPESVYDKDFIQELEKRVEIKLEKEMKETIEYIQNEFETDIVHFNVVMQRYAPDLWEKVKEDWDEVFPTIDVEITADAEIRLVGLMK